MTRLTSSYLSNSGRLCFRVLLNVILVLSYKLSRKPELNEQLDDQLIMIWCIFLSFLQLIQDELESSRVNH